VNSEQIKNAPKSTNHLSVKDAFDADLHASNLTNWNQEYDQVSPGRFKGRIVELPFEGLQVFKESTNQALQQKCLVWPNSVWLGIPQQNQAPCKINGMSVTQKSIMCRPGNHAFELSTPQDFELFGMVMNQSLLTEFADTHGVALNWSDIKTHGRLSLPSQTLKNVRFILGRLLNENDTISSSKLSHDLLMIAMLEVLSAETPQPSQTPSFKRRKTVVDTAKTYISDNADTPITITDLCKVASVSQRTLQYSFESILGISPIQYLRISRLNAVRRALLSSGEEANILDIASLWGFWHMSQFAKDYKRLFGELPSQTKMRTTQWLLGY